VQWDVTREPELRSFPGTILPYLHIATRQVIHRREHYQVQCHLAELQLGRPRRTALRDPLTSEYREGWSLLAGPGAYQYRFDLQAAGGLWPWASVGFMRQDGCLGTGAVGLRTFHVVSGSPVGLAYPVSPGDEAAPLLGPSAFRTVVDAVMVRMSLFGGVLQPLVRSRRSVEQELNRSFAVWQGSPGLATVQVALPLDTPEQDQPSLALYTFSVRSPLEARPQP
jgi:hypothetical protein